MRNAASPKVSGETVEMAGETVAGQRMRAVGRTLAGGLSREETRALVCWTLAAFVPRLLLAWRVEHVISPDGVQYVTLGQNLAAGNFREGLSTYFPPLYPLLVGLASLVFRDAEFAGRMVSVVAGSLLVVPVHGLIRKWYGGRVAHFGACVVALHPVLIYYSTVVLTESVYTLLFTYGVLAGWTALSGGRARAYVLAGAAFGACYLLKPEAAGFLILLIALTLGRKFFDRTHAFVAAARGTVLLSAGFMMLAAPYLFYLRWQAGEWVISGKTGGHLLQGSRRAGEGFAPLAGTVADGLTGAFVQLTKALRFEYELFNLIFPVAFVMLAALGLFRERWTRERAGREAYLFSFVAAALAGYAVTLPNVRFLVPLLPLLLCWVSKGIVEFEGWATGTLEAFRRARARQPRPARRDELHGERRGVRYGEKLFVPVIVAVLIASLLPVSVYLLRGDKWSDYRGQKRAAEWIREHDAARVPVIMSTVPVAAFYAGARHVALADEDYAAFISRARREGVGHVVVNERDFRYMRLRPLLEEGVEHPGLRLAHSLSEGSGQKILVYAFERGAGVEPGAPPPASEEAP